ncbi:MAG: (2Fe-2S) ferredoxin domain-containing protein [Nitrospira sp.]|nr:(2Fe-2S) ferredoxin domain-containing protein [bacterium]MBL7047915.1 (2Fe-2S) ferredoxin domain-containing protein [Nitrospira sp.]
MAKLTIADLKKIKDKQKATFTLREGGYKAKVTVHMGTCGIAAGAREIMTTLMDIISESEEKVVIATTSGCAGLCAREPMATVEVMGSAPVKYGDLTPDKMKDIYKEHVQEGNPVEKYAIVIGNESTY